jgi:hypothetical protein
MMIEKKIMNKKTIISFIAMMLFSLAIIGCNSEKLQEPSKTIGTNNAQKISPEKITYISADYFSGNCVVYVISPGKIDYYDWSSSWRNGYSWFDAETWMYQNSWVQYKLEDDEWNSIVDTMNEKGLSGLPEDLSVEDVMDGGSSTIEVLTSSDRFISGGSNVQGGKSNDQKNFTAIESVIRGVLDNACIKERYSDDYLDSRNKKIALFDTIPLVMFLEKSGLFENELESVIDMYVIYSMGEKYDRSNIEITKGIMDKRMSVEDLTEFYNKVLGYDRVFTPQSVRPEGERSFCLEDGYVYALADYDLIRMYSAYSSFYSEPGPDGVEMEGSIYYNEPGSNEPSVYMNCHYTLEYSDNSYGYTVTSFVLTPSENQ